MRKPVYWLASALLSAVTVLAHAQPFPQRPVTLIVPFPPGGPSDALGRLVAQGMTKQLDQQVIVENVGGAGGTLGAGRAAQARPDGHTMLLAHIGQATSVSLYRKLPYDPVEAFAGVGLIGEVPMVVIGRKDLPPKNGRELLDYIRVSKGAVTYANAGTGSASHLCGLLFMNALQTQMNVISYRGSGPATTDVLAGRIDVQCDQTSTAGPHIRTGAVKGYAVTMRERVAAVPELPTLHESGLRDFELSVWYGLLVPKGSPKPAADRLAAALRAAVADADVTKRLNDFGAQPAASERATPAWFDAFMRAEVTKWAPIIKAAGVFAD